VKERRRTDIHFTMNVHPAFPMIWSVPMTAVFVLATACQQDSQMGNVFDTNDESATVGMTSGPEGGGSEQGSEEGSEQGSEQGSTPSTSVGSEGNVDEGNPDTSASASASETGTPVFDVGNDDSGGAESGSLPSCKVVDDLDAVPECMEKSPPDSFTPEFQWSWTDGSINQVPLVANLTDDNGDGNIDLCDVPDVVVVMGTSGLEAFGQIIVLDGATGTEHFTIEGTVSGSMTPAIGDIDNDGLPEIVAQQGPGGTMIPKPLVAYEHDGTLKWVGAQNVGYSFGLALADLDNDGDVEIITNHSVSDHNGALLWVAAVPSCTTSFLYAWANKCPTTSMAADLDGNGDLEIIAGKVAYHHDGTVYFNNPTATANGGKFVWPQVANLDDDPQPEVLLTSAFGDILILEHDGANKMHRPGTNAPTDYSSPAAVHDFDGDGAVDFGIGVSTRYDLHARDGTVKWTKPVTGGNEQAPAGTAFDFLGNGVAQAVYNDQMRLYVYNGSTGAVQLQVDNPTMGTLSYPIVADIDNDGSAEILTTSTGSNAGVHAIRDKEDRWIQARRIWNQHTYHVTNVREDGTIPQSEPPHWETLNTFRTNAQIEGGLCKPPMPEG